MKEDRRRLKWMYTVVPIVQILLVSETRKVGRRNEIFQVRVLFF